MHQSPGEPCRHHQQSTSSSATLQQTSCWPAPPTGCARFRLEPGCWPVRGTLLSWLTLALHCSGKELNLSAQETFCSAQSHNALNKSPRLDHSRWNFNEIKLQLVNRGYCHVLLCSYVFTDRCTELKWAGDSKLFIGIKGMVHPLIKHS